MTCDEFRPFLDDYVTGALGPSARAVLDRHVSDCAACLAESRALQAVDRALAAEPVLDPPAGFADRIMARIPSRRSLLRSESVRIAAAVLLMAGVGLATSLTAVRASAEQVLRENIRVSPEELIKAAKELPGVLPFGTKE